ncbi:MAG: hypothetical protein GEV07_30140 [Streptosporangiales bacterium]|nr:hypothetical protein [Streptosporangiales bacterium]
MAKLTMLRCGTCGQRYSNPARHVCRTRLDRKRRPGKTRVKPRVSFTCRTCGKATTNPLMHTCRVRTDFKRRKARQERLSKATAKSRRAAARRKAARKTARPATGGGTSSRASTPTPAAPRPAAPSFNGGPSSTSEVANHDYRECFQKSAGTRFAAAHDCPKYPCRIYREGHTNGLEVGRQLGHATGYSEGYSTGYAEATRDHANER